MMRTSTPLTETAIRDYLAGHAALANPRTRVELTFHALSAENARVQVRELTPIGKCNGDSVDEFYQDFRYDPDAKPLPEYARFAIVETRRYSGVFVSFATYTMEHFAKMERENEENGRPYRYRMIRDEVHQVNR